MTEPDQTAGTGLPGPLRERLEHSFGADLRAVRVHTGAAADRLTRRLCADAVTCGSDIFFREGAYRPDTEAGRWLIAHEAAHVVQQARGTASGAALGTWQVSVPGDSGEREADRYANAALAGRVADPGLPHVSARREPSRVLQRHSSFEHRLLGDAQTDELLAIARRTDGYRGVLKRQIGFMDLWASNPDRVTEEQVKAAMPSVRTLRIGPDQVLVTYGELNALPDYLANPEAINTMPSRILTPVLQVIRQETYNELTKLHVGENPLKKFAGAAATPRKYPEIHSVLEALDLDEHTLGLGTEGRDHYQGLLARNACHFAPFSWYRWNAAHLMAREFAKQWYEKGDPELKRQAWIYHGYADHFLQDSFAAGHLVNKTLIMQWFVEWVAKTGLDIADWDAIKGMTTSKQPRLAGRMLYRAMWNAVANDPQTVQEAATVVARMTNSGVQPDDQTDIDTAYQNYLTFLTSTVAQYASNVAHNYYNDHALWVASDATPQPYQVWGDHTLLTGKSEGKVEVDASPGLEQTSIAAQLSQQALEELLRRGKTSIDPDHIRLHLPTKAGDDRDNLVDLERWNDSKRAFCEEAFHAAVNMFRVMNYAAPRIGVISQDQRFTGVWNVNLEGAGYSPGEMVYVQAQGRLFAASQGWAYELDPASGKVRKKLKLGYLNNPAVGNYESRIATDGKMLFVGTHGYAYGIAVDDFEKVRWSTGLGRHGYHEVSLLVAGDELFAACNGYVYSLDPATGQKRRPELLATPDRMPGDYDTRLDTDGSRLYVGVHGRVSAINLTVWAGTEWSTELPGPEPSSKVTVLSSNGRLFAGCDGYAYELSPGNGTVVHRLLLAKAGFFDGAVTRLATNGRRLFAGVRGFVHGIPLNDWSADATWKTGVSDKNFGSVAVLVVGDRLYAGSRGYVHRLDPDSGAERNQLLLTYAFTPSMCDTSLASDGQHLFVAVNGFAYKVLVNDERRISTIFHQRRGANGWRERWTPDVDGAPYQVTQVTGAVGRTGKLEAFAVDEEGVLYHNTLAADGAWGGNWVPNFAGAPRVRSVTPLVGPAGDLHVFAVGTDGLLYHNCQDANGWQPHWDPKFDNAPSGIRSVAGAVGPTGDLEVFAVDDAAVLHHNSLDRNTGWQGKWESNFLSAPAVESVLPIVGPTGDLEVFAVGVQNDVYHTSLNARTGWQDEWAKDFQHAPPMRALAGALTPDGERLEVFGIGKENNVLYRTGCTRDGAGGVTWDKVWKSGDEEDPAVREVAAAAGATGPVEVFAVGTDEVLYHHSTDVTASPRWDRGFYRAPATRSITALTGPGGTVELFAIAAY